MLNRRIPRFRPNAQTLQREQRRREQVTQEKKMQNIWLYMEQLLERKDSETRALIEQARSELLSEVRRVIAGHKKNTLRVPQDGKTPVKGVDYFDGKDGNPGDPGEPGYTPRKGVDYFDGTPGEPGYSPRKGVDYFDGQAPSAKEVAAEILPEIERLYEEYLRRIQKFVGKRLYLHGGGSSSSAAGTNVADELLTTGITQNGNDVDIDLSVLAHSYTTILQVRRNGQPQVRGISWSQAGSTATVKGADASELFEIQYTYA